MARTSRMPRPLTPKQRRFVAEYLIDLNATRAAKTCGYHPKMAAQLLALSSIKTEIAKGTARQLDKAELTADMVKARLRLIAFQDIRLLFDENGNLRPLHTLGDEAAPMIAGMEVIIKNAEAGDGVTDRVHKIKVVDPLKPLEILAKHFGLLVEKHEHQVKFTLEDLVSGSMKASE